jgi:glycosyltransferase involved in cell wall biosynthesis
MKVGIIGTLWQNTPPEQYGGTEVVVANLIDGLVDKGHDVTFFGPATAKVKCKIIPTVDKPLREKNVEWANTAFTLFHLTEAFDRASDFDIIHMQLNKSQDYISLPLAMLSKTPVLFTLHFKLPNEIQHPGRHRVLVKYKELPYTSISDSQRAPIPLNFISTVYNSLKLTDYTFNDKPEDYFVWLGKINPVKGTKEAIVAAKMANVKLILMGATDPGVPEYMQYFEKDVIPLVDNKQIILKTNVSLEEKVAVLSKAKGLLNPIIWEEPFGLVMAEAQATGTPVIAFRRGAAPEVIVDGKTGFVVDNISEMVLKIGQIGNIDRHACRENVEQKFTVEVMANNYEKAYNIAISNWTSYLDKQTKYIENDHKKQHQNI